MEEDDVVIARAIVDGELRELVVTEIGMVERRWHKPVKFAGRTTSRTDLHGKDGITCGGGYHIVDYASAEVIEQYGLPQIMAGLVDYCKQALQKQNRDLETRYVMHDSLKALKEALEELLPQTQSKHLKPYATWATHPPTSISPVEATNQEKEENNNAKKP